MGSPIFIPFVAALAFGVCFAPVYLVARLIGVMAKGPRQLRAEFRMRAFRLRVEHQIRTGYCTHGVPMARCHQRAECVPELRQRIWAERYADVDTGLVGRRRGRLGTGAEVAVCAVAAAGLLTALVVMAG